MTHEALHSWLAAGASGLRGHLVLSTVILVALLGVSLLPFLRPRTRYALAFLGVVKFLLPAAVLLERRSA